MCCTIVFNWTPVFTLFDRWCYFQYSEVSSCMITVADKSLERPIKSYFVLSLIYSSGTKCDTPSRFVWDYFTQDLCRVGHDCVTVRVGMF